VTEPPRPRTAGGPLPKRRSLGRGWWVSLKFVGLTRARAAPISLLLLSGKLQGPMTELYLFRGTTGHAEMVTDDKSGKKLPPHSFGE
jgi:hypothetical protein